MFGAFNTTWVPAVFHVVKRAISSYHSEEALQVVKQSGFVKRLLCNYLGDWKAASAKLSFDEAKFAGMAAHKPFQSQWYLVTSSLSVC